MYTAILGLHSWLRWAALALLVASLVLAWRKDNGAGARKLSVFTLIAFHTQLLLGLLLYAVLSPFTQAAFADFGAAMKSAATRFWAVEHIFGMVLAIALVQVGHVRAKRATEDGAAAKSRLIFFGLGLVLTLALIPWPGRAAGRDLFWFGGAPSAPSTGPQAAAPDAVPTAAPAAPDESETR